MTNFLRSLIGEKAYERLMQEGGLKPFKPCVAYFEGMDFLLCLEEDCSYTEKWLPGSDIELLYAPEGDRLVGVKINCFSSLVPPAVLEAFKRAYPVS